MGWRARKYYTLVSSLPWLPHFTQADHLPLTRLRLDQRLGLLHEDDAAELETAGRLTLWQHQPLARTDADVVRMTEQVLASTRHPGLRQTIEDRMTQRTIVSALRRRRLGQHRPPPRPWGASRWVGALERGWSKHAFGLEHVFPWIPEAAELLEAADAMGLERQQMDLVWGRLSLLAEAEPFGFGAVVAFVYKWDIISRWLNYAPEAAAARFQKLMEEAIGEHDIIG